MDFTFVQLYLSRNSKLNQLKNYLIFTLNPMKNSEFVSVAKISNFFFLIFYLPYQGLFSENADKKKMERLKERVTV